MSKLDYIRMMVYSQTQAAIMMLLQEGMSIKDIVVVTRDLRDTVWRAYEHAVAAAGHNLAGGNAPPPADLSDLDPDKKDDENPNPFT